MKNVCLLLFAILAGSLYAAQYKTKTYSEVHAFGLERDWDKHLTYRFEKLHRPPVSLNLPAEINLSAKVSGPENQGSCGSCWAFAITKALRSAWMLSGKDPGRLAFNYLLNNCGGVVNEYGCQGGDFNAGENMINGRGPWLESQDPYTQREGSCKQGLAISGTAVSWNLVGNGHTPPTFEQLAQAIAQNHVLAIDVAVCGQWESYSSGIFNANQCGAESVNHMINLVGYNCQTSQDNGVCKFNAKGQPVNHDGYLIVMNNWGTSWGDKGYMKTRWGVDAIADTAMYFEIK